MKELNEINNFAEITRKNPAQWMDLLWDVIWDYEDCKHRNNEIKNEENFKVLMDEVKTIMWWIEEDLEIERDMYKTEHD